MTCRREFREAICALALCCIAVAGNEVIAAVPAPALNTVFPAGGQAGQAVEVTIAASNWQGSLRTLKCSAPGVRVEIIDAAKVRLVIPADTVPGSYELWAVGENGISSPRSFWIGNRSEQLETQPNDSIETATSISLNSVVNGQIDKPSDVDHFRFDASKGQRVVIECQAERIDSRLRGVIELFDATGRRLAVNRGYFGSDPLIDFPVPADGTYFVKLQDLISSGSAEHYYRLDIDSGPRVAFCVPSVVEHNQPATITLYGWNLGSAPSDQQSSIPADFDSLRVVLDPQQLRTIGTQSLRLASSQAALNMAAYYLPGSHAAIPIAVTDVPVVLEQPGNHSPVSAQSIPCPCAVAGRLVNRDDCDWYSIDARRGEVFFLELFAQRLQSQVHPQLNIYGADGQREIATFSDSPANSDDLLPTGHLDPAGRWVAPADGRYLIAVRNLAGGAMADSRRNYCLDVRREEPDFDLLVVPRRDNVAGLNVSRGGSDVLEVQAFRHRGMSAAIRISAVDLPAGIECPDVWLGPSVNRCTLVVTADRTLVVTADRNAVNGVTELKFIGTAEGLESRPVRSGAIVRPGTPSGWGRLTSQIPVAVTGDAPLRIRADGHGTVDHHLYGKLTARHSPGGVLDIEIQIERSDRSQQSPVRLTGVGLPPGIENQSVIIPADEEKGFISFCLPPTLDTGKYTVAVRAETMVATSDKKKTEKWITYSNPVTIDVQPAAMLVRLDPFVQTKAKRGENFEIHYSVERRNGFIGKVHTELAVPGSVTKIEGLLCRGVTFTGQADKASIQVIVKDTAPLGPQYFLRLFAVGVLEDEALFHSSQVIPLEIVE